MTKSKQNAGHPVLSQLVKLIPYHLVKQAVAKYESDKYYKTLTTYHQLVFLLYGVVTKCNSLNTLCKSLAFMDGTLKQLGISKLPARSTLSDANRKRNSDVFAHLYYLLLNQYSKYLRDDLPDLFVYKEFKNSQVKAFDATTLSLFNEVFKGAGCTPINGKRKGGLKVHTLLSQDSYAPELVALRQAAGNDRTFLGQLPPAEPGTIYLMDKGYINYLVFEQWTKQGVFFVTPMRKDAVCKILADHSVDLAHQTGEGITHDLTVEFDHHKGKVLTCRLLYVNEPESGRPFWLMTNLMDVSPEAVWRLYRNRWRIEVYFKQLKQNFQLQYFYSDSREGIKTQVWVALIAHLLITLVHRMLKEAEQFSTIRSMLAMHMSSFKSFWKVLKMKRNEGRIRNKEIIQLELDLSG